MRGLQGKVAIVTGATQEMGMTISERLVEEGAKVVAAGRTEENGEALVDRIGAGGGEALFVRCDVTVESEVSEVVGAAVERFGRLDIVVNNAAAVDTVRGQERPVADQAPEVFDWIMRVGCYGPFYLARQAIPHMVAGGQGGSFVSISSIAARRAAPARTAYAPSKAALDCLTRQIAVDYGRQGIRANIVTLGAVRVSASERLHDHPVAGARLREMQMIDVVGRPHHVASAVAFLVSDEAAFVTGTDLAVDGGASMIALELDWSAIYAEMEAGGGEVVPASGHPNG